MSRIEDADKLIRSGAPVRVTAADEIAFLRYRIANLEAELDKCKMRTLSPEADRLVSEYTTKYKALEVQLAEEKEKTLHKAEYIAELKRLAVDERREARARRLELQAENQRLQGHIWQLEASIQDLIAKKALEKET